MANIKPEETTGDIQVEKVKRSRIVGSKENYEKYICPSCESLLIDAVQCGCGHRYCKKCAISLLEEDENPYCKVEEDGEKHRVIDEDDKESPKYFPDKFAQKEIGAIKVTCQFEDCKEKMPLKDLKDHLRVCNFATQPCPHCGRKFRVDQLSNHTSKCPEKKKTCPLGQLQWNNELDGLLGDAHSLKQEWDGVLQECNEKEFKPDEWNKHIGAQDNHYRVFAGVINTLVKLNIQLCKDQKSKPIVIGTDVDRDGDAKAQRRSAFHGSDVVPDGVAGPSREMEKQMMILQTTVEGMRKDSIQSRNEFIATQNDLSHALEQIKDLRAKVDFFEQKLSTREQQLEEKDFRISLLEAANYDGTMIWRIAGFESRTKDARDARYTSIFSLPFYTSKYGYKMCLRLYPLGDGMGKNTHLSLFFVVMKSEYDSLLQWPFTNKVTLTLINQSGGPDVTDTFKPDPKSSSFQRPKTEMNVASGCPRFVPLDDLHRNGFIKDDTIFIKVKVETISTRY